MRSDMHKVIVERPRMLRSAWKNKKTARRLSTDECAQVVREAEDYDGGPVRASSARHEKHLNENLAPLRRYLASQVGRPWNKVYSEICKTIDTRAAIGLHVLQHLEGFIALDVYKENDVLYERGRWGHAIEVRGLYVDPATGLIRLVKRRKPRAKHFEPTLIAVSETFEYHKIDDLWFAMQYRLAEPGELVDGIPVRRVLMQKRQCDRKTIRRLLTR